MSQRDNSNSRLTRRSWIVLATSALAGCGGGGGESGSTAGAPGTGGTGVYAMGSISGFGSVIVNGIKFDDLQASVKVDGIAATPADLRLGMVASVQGSRGAVATLGTANSIEIWSIAKGLVTQGHVIPGAVGQFTVAGMTVQTDSATVFDDGLSATTPLSPGLRVAVWGLQAAADGSRWIATRVAVVPDTAVVSTGFVTAVSSTAPHYLNGLLLTGSLAGTLSAGDLARVQGTLTSSGTSLTVASVKLLGPSAGVHPTGEVEIEGMVTTTPLAGRFSLGSIQVDAIGAVYIPAGAQIAKDDRIEVYGTWQAGVLKATRIEIENAQTLGEVEIEAAIELVISPGVFVVRGQRCDATLATISHGTLADLILGAKVHLKGIMSGDVVKVTELELDI